MSVLQFTPCILHEDWAGFVEWCARTFDLPVACRFDEKGWARLAASSPGLTVLHSEPFTGSSANEPVVVELEVDNAKNAIARAVAEGASLVTEPVRVGEGQWHAAIRSPQGIRLFLFQAAVPEDEGMLRNGPVHFTAARTIAAPIEKVFEAITRPEHLEKTFVTRVTGTMTAKGETAVWYFEGHGEAPLHVTEFRPNAYVAFHWQANRMPYHTSVEFKLTAAKDGTRLAVTESGWDPGVQSLKSAFEHCEGWTTFLGNTKMYVENGIASMKARV
jgi:uncharacterized protein YndB with AHSA1/START domain